MIVAHIGPPLARTGGPAGYLWQLRDALSTTETAHRVLFPEATAACAPSAPVRASLSVRIRRRIRRALTGEPRFRRPSPEDLQRRGGTIDRMVRAALDDMVRAAEPSLARARGEGADVLFTHDLGTALRALEVRRAGQPVWLMLHSPMSHALYLAWNWGVPEQDWREVLEFPDVRFWTKYEVDACARVDRLLLPCREAAADLVRCDPAFASPLARAHVVPTGGSRGSNGAASASASRQRWGLPLDQPVGLFLGNLQAYRGFDALLAGLSRLRDLKALPGVIAVAGPDRSAVPAHPRVRPLGRVEDVSALLQSVDFVVNLNRFSLFDLSLIEAFEAGRPVLLHHSGGNRAFAALGAGCVLVDGLEPGIVAAALSRCFEMSRPELAALGEQSRACYRAHLTPARFASHHMALYDRALQDEASEATA